MRMRTIKFIAPVFLSAFLMGLSAQEAIPAAGGSASGSGGTVAYTLGQTVYSSYSEENGTLSQGVQQAYEIYIYTGMDLSNIKLNIAVYPIPTSGILTLTIEEEDFSKLTYQLFDIQGKLIANSKILSNSTNIDIQDQASSTYFLKIVKAQQSIKAFKIIKN